MQNDIPLTIFSGQYLRAVAWNVGSAQRLVATFDHYRAGRCGFPELRRSVRFTAPGFGQISITSAANDWFLNPDLKPLRMALRATDWQGAEVVGLGLSMGGYGALMLSRALRLTRVLLVSPQLSILPRLAPFEARWRAEAARVDPDLDRVDVSIRAGLRGVVLFDPAMKRDRRHAWAIHDLAPLIRPVALRFAGHPALQHIKDAGMYPRLQEMVMHGGIVPARVRALHRAARAASDLWRDHLADWADQAPADPLEARHHPLGARRGRLGLAGDARDPTPGL